MSARRIASPLPLVVALALLGGLVSGAGALALLSRPKSAQATVGVERRPAAAPCTPSSPCLAIVVDDLGRDPHALRELLRLDAELTFAVLPHAAYTAHSVAAIRARGRELLLHLPLEPLDRGKITDERVVLGQQGDLAAATAACLARVPGAVGINNHLGSAVSAERASVDQILAAARERRLFFLDSRTSERSVICRAAREAQVPCLERDVFLDDPPEDGAIASRWEEAVTRARLGGRAIVIAHPHPATIRALRDLVARARAGCREVSGACGPQGMRLVRVSSLVEAEM